MGVILLLVLRGSMHFLQRYVPKTIFTFPLDPLPFDLKVALPVTPISFLSPMGRHTLPSHASAEACLTGWHNVQPQGRDYCSVA